MAQFRRISLAAILLFFLPDGELSSDDSLVNKIDMFKEVGLLSKQFTGVTRTTGKEANSPAFNFTLNAPDLIANQEAYDEAKKLITGSEDFSIIAWAKIDSNPSYFYRNPIVSISSQGGDQLYLLVMISAYRSSGGLSVTVTVQDPRKRSVTYKDNTGSEVDFKQWHEIEVRFQAQESLIRIFVDGHMILVKRFSGFDTLDVGSQLRLAQVYEVGGENIASITDRFKGSLQDVKFAERNTKSGDCSSPQPCKCTDVVEQKSCVVDGFKYEDGQRWEKNKCTICDCKLGQVICTHTCKVCSDNGTTYFHEDTWQASNNSCLGCRCEEGKSVCSLPSCPRPDCAGKSGDTVIPEGKCCPVCKEDQCLGTGKVYHECGCTTTCANYRSQGIQCRSCSQGCFCPPGKVHDESGQCVDPVDCPCRYKGKIYEPNEEYSDSCEWCLCLNGDMTCFNLCGNSQ